MGTADIEKHCVLDPASSHLLERSVEKLELSACAYHRILKIVRIVADIATKETIGLSHVAEAVQHRRQRLIFHSYCSCNIACRFLLSLFMMYTLFLRNNLIDFDRPEVIKLFNACGC